MGPIQIESREVVAGAKYRQVVAMSSFPFSLLCLSESHLELLITFELAQFCTEQPKQLEPMVAISTSKLPKGQAILARNSLDAESCYLHLRSSTGHDVFTLDLACLGKLRSDFESEQIADLVSLPCV